jgi:hypothetical protein
MSLSHCFCFLLLAPLWRRHSSFNMYKASTTSCLNSERNDSVHQKKKNLQILKGVLCILTSIYVTAMLLTPPSSNAPVFNLSYPFGPKESAGRGDFTVSHSKPPMSHSKPPMRHSKPPKKRTHRHVKSYLKKRTDRHVKSYLRTMRRVRNT